MASPYMSAQTVQVFMSQVVKLNCTTAQSLFLEASDSACCLFLAGANEEVRNLTLLQSAGTKVAHFDLGCVSAPNGKGGVASEDPKVREQVTLQLEGLQWRWEDHRAEGWMQMRGCGRVGGALQQRCIPTAGGTTGTHAACLCDVYSLNAQMEGN